MKTRACLGWVSVVLMGMLGLSQAEAADKPGTPSKPAASAAGGASTAGAAGESARAADDDDFGDVDDLVPVPPSSSPSSSRSGSLQGTVASPMTVAEEKPDRYEIQRGDTLWDISSRFWGDPYFWPKLWSYNPYIGNAHQIYPGNVLRFYAGSYVRPPSMDIEGRDGGSESSETIARDIRETVQPETVIGEDKACSPPVPFLERGGSVAARAYGFLREQGFGPVGKIVKAPESKVLLSDRDIVYLQFSRMSDVQCGDVYTIYEPTRKKVAHPIYKRRVLGSLFRVLGEVEVIDVNDFIATGRIRLAVGEIQRGDLLTARVDVAREVNIHPSSREVEGYIVQALNQENTTLGPNDIVYIDRGEQDGVTAGEAFYIVRQGDGLDGLVMKGERDISLPYQIIGKVVVTAPGEYVSEAIITEASGVIEVGDHVTTQIN